MNLARRVEKLEAEVEARPASREDLQSWLGPDCVSLEDAHEALDGVLSWLRSALIRADADQATGLQRSDLLAWSDRGRIEDLARNVYAVRDRFTDGDDDERDRLAAMVFASPPLWIEYLDALCIGRTMPEKLGEGLPDPRDIPVPELRGHLQAIDNGVFLTRKPKTIWPRNCAESEAQVEAVRERLGAPPRF